MNCCFTGHKRIKSTRNLENTIKKELKALIDAGVTDFYSGGAYGWETMCGLAVLKLRKKYPHIKLHLILPCPAREQTARWNDSRREVYYKIMNSADSVEIISEEYFDGCVKIRDMRLVEAADRCFCYYNEKLIGGSTAQVVRLAVKKGIEVINIYLINN
ncbi:MAG: DUF1273 domain-containing protein [Ruminococcus sp.]|nr:DUF1273 domain-containing protein [Ruminococcus sp.]MCM1381445.1 DUF1273 domain-containing protein [Muribaculaceae bacterium]MCM1479264.1 DUF1273 domain-containing protein [Muribaculaceae bacterium]